MKTNKSKLILMAFCLTTGILFAQTKKASNVREVLFSVEMDCQSCKAKIEKNIAFEKGVKALAVDFKKQTVMVRFDATKTNAANLQKAFEKLGYKAQLLSSHNPCCASDENGSHDCCEQSESSHCCSAEVSTIAKNDINKMYSNSNFN